MWEMELLRAAWRSIRDEYETEYSLDRRREMRRRMNEIDESLLVLGGWA